MFHFKVNPTAITAPRRTPKVGGLEHKPTAKERVVAERRRLLHIRFDVPEGGDEFDDETIYNNWDHVLQYLRPSSLLDQWMAIRKRRQSCDEQESDDNSTIGSSDSDEKSGKETPEMGSVDRPHKKIRKP
jgi:hypothetical protein